ncbi:MAG: DUF6145 family protein [Lachnospiraceae bacterium]|nr:DUF6145 family protein [Lachnospiraceae bacterium]
MKEKTVLCGASAYEKKYYFNKDFDGLPDSIKKELNIICVLFTEEVGGVLTFVYDEEGELSLETEADEGDLLYDDIGSGLLIKEVLKNKQELFNALTIYYKVFILKQDPSDLLYEE